jgi:hypothetical protein
VILVLTSLYYYGHYRPYILNRGSQNLKSINNVSKINDKLSNFYLNKTLKDDVIDYANSTAKSIVQIKEGARKLSTDMQQFDKYLEQSGIKTAKYWLAENIENFVDSYNNASKILTEQDHSDTLKLFIENVLSDIIDNIYGLNELGINMDSDSTLSFDITKINNSSVDLLNEVIYKTLYTIENIYNRSTEILKEPLSSHMQFSKLTYYYNYKLGGIETNTFDMIQRGMILDISV